MFTLIKFELKKLLQTKAAFISMLVAIIVMFGMVNMTFFSGQMSGSKHDPVHGIDAIRINRRIADEHTDYLNENQLTKVLEDYSSNAKELDEKGIYSIFSHMVISSFFEDPTELLVKIHQHDKDVDLTKAKLKNLSEIGLVLPKKQIKLGNFVSWNTLFIALNSVFLVLIVTTLFICSPVFSGETMRGIEDILLTTRYGKNRLTIAKIIAVYLFGIALFSVTYGSIFGVFHHAFGWSGWDTSVQCNLYWVTPISNILMFPVKMNLFEACLQLFLLQFVGLLFMIAICILISSRTSNPLSTFGTVILVYYLPEFLMQIFKYGVINKLLTIFNVSTNNFDELLLKLSNNNDFVFNDFYFNISMVNVLRIALILSIFVTVYFHLNKKKL